MPRDTHINTEAIAQAAMQYAALGWHVLPLRGRSKVPRISEWQHNANDDEEIVAGWWEQWPDSNVGVQLGPRSGIIDIEADTPRAEVEMQVLFDGSIPPCPMFQAKRGKHRLLQWRGDLVGGACFHCGEIEIRTGNGDKGAQSVFPPSIHESGIQYKWLISPFEVEPPELPEAVYVKLCNYGGESPIRSEKDAKSYDHYAKILAGVGEGSRNESMASYVGRLLRSLSGEAISTDDTIRIMFESCCAVNEHNTPPLNDKEMRATFTSILKAERARRAGERVDAMLVRPPEQQIEDKSKFGGWRVVTIDSDPPTYELYSPLFTQADGGKILLDGDDMLSAYRIRKQALVQAQYPLATDFTKLWNRRDGLYVHLVLGSDACDAPAEIKRHVVVAELLWARLRVASTLNDGAEPDSKGLACRLQDGSIVFGFTRILGDLNFSVDKITRLELSRLLQTLGAKEHRKTEVRLMLLPPDAVAALQKIANPEPRTTNHHIGRAQGEK